MDFGFTGPVDINEETKPEAELAQQQPVRAITSSDCSAGTGDGLPLAMASAMSS